MSEESKNKKKLLVKLGVFLGIALALIAAFRVGMSFGAGNGEPGTQSDPLVTLSYLESRLQDVGGDNSGTGTGRGSGMTRVSLSRGDELKLDSGTLLVVYSGSGTIQGGSGMVNISSGELFSDGMTAVLYSLYMALGSESAIHAKGNMTVYVSGGYSLE